MRQQRRIILPVDGEVGEGGAHAEDDAAADHGHPTSDQADEEARQGEDCALGHAPHGLHHDEVAVGQVRSPMLPEKYAL